MASIDVGSKRYVITHPDGYSYQIRFLGSMKFGMYPILACDITLFFGEQRLRSCYSIILAMSIMMANTFPGYSNLFST